MQNLTQVLFYILNSHITCWQISHRGMMEKQWHHRILSHISLLTPWHVSTTDPVKIWNERTRNNLQADISWHKMKDLWCSITKHLMVNKPFHSHHNHVNWNVQHLHYIMIYSEWNNSNNRFPIWKKALLNVHQDLATIKSQTQKCY